jgi:hypothetical protein
MIWTYSSNSTVFPEAIVSCRSLATSGSSPASRVASWRSIVSRPAFGFQWYLMCTASAENAKQRLNRNHTVKQVIALNLRAQKQNIRLITNLRNHCS